MQIIAPNGSVSVMLYYKGKLVGRISKQVTVLPEHQVYIVGITDSPLLTCFGRSNPFGCISIELNPAAAKFANVSYTR